MPEADGRDDLSLLRESVSAAGHIARKYFGGSYKQWSKGPGNPVTEADLEVDRFLRERLRAARPGYGWLSEESDADRLSAERVFVVDPIDGTIAFLKGKPHFTICAAVVTGGRPVAGVVYNPITEECFSAEAGHGAFCSGVRLAVGARDSVEGCRMLGDRTMFANPKWDVPPSTPWPEMDIQSRGSVAYRLALVAKNEFDAALALSAKRDWDLAAADIILSEAGGKVTSASGGLLRYNGVNATQPTFVAAGPALHEKLIARLKHLPNQEKA